MAAKHSESYVINASLESIRSAILDPQFSKELNLELKSENPMLDYIWFRFHHGTTMLSWGEKITITLTETGDSSTKVDILSECGMPTQIIDYGKNKQNVCNIYEYLQRNVSVSQSANSAPSANVIFCTQCGKKLPADSYFCSGCGSKVK